MEKLFLDDERNPKDAYQYTQDPIYLESDWIVVRNSEEFSTTIVRYFVANGRTLPKLISFDHDLAPEHYQFLEHPIEYDWFQEKTGYHCAKWLFGFCKKQNIAIPQIKVHSMNPAGKENILALFGLQETWFDKLTELQTKVGYKVGEIHPIAVLGLAGEVGEVLDELKVDRNHREQVELAIEHCAKLDNLKKLVRDKFETITIELNPERVDYLDLEISDVLYYLNALAVCRGKKLEDYAELSFNKVSKRIQTDISQGVKNLENGGLKPEPKFKEGEMVKCNVLLKGHCQTLILRIKYLEFDEQSRLWLYDLEDAENQKIWQGITDLNITKLIINE